MIRIISCLDIKNNFVVKGIKFKKLKKILRPELLASYYEKVKVDEIVILDITSNYTIKSLSYKLIKKISKLLTIPISIGGGIKTFDKIYKFYKIGADKIVLNSYLYDNIKILKLVSSRFGSQSIICAIDIKIKKNKIKTYRNSGFYNTNFNLFDWSIICKKLGTGEILITSIMLDGNCQGYDVKMFYNLKKKINISLIVSGGFGSINDIYYLYKYCKIKNFLIATLLHNKLILPLYIKKYLYKYVNKN